MIASGPFQYDVFLSHNSKDKPRVRRLAARLRDAGLRVWLDDWMIRAGDIILLKVEEGLNQSRVLLLCMSPDAFGSGWVALERSTAMHRDPANTGRRFVPLLLADCELPDTVRIYKYVDFRNEAESAFSELLAACQTPTGPVADATAYMIPTESSPAATEAQWKLDTEIGHRLRLLPVLLEDVFTFTQLHSAKGAVLGYSEIRPRVGKLGEFDPLFPEFHRRSLFLLIWNLRERVADDEKRALDHALESAKALPHLFNHLVMLAPVGEEDSKWQIDREHLDRARAILRGLERSRWDTIGHFRLVDERPELPPHLALSLERYHSLVDRQLIGELTTPEKAELARLEDALDAFEAENRQPGESGFWGRHNRALRRLERRVARLSARQAGE